MTLIPFADWTPDLPDLGNPGVTVALNCLPQAKGYRHFPGLQPYVSTDPALPSRCIGAIAVLGKDGNAYNYAANVGEANACKLSVLSGGDWIDASGNGADATPGYACADGEPWEFVEWKKIDGTETVIAANINEPLQTIDLGGANFANLIVSARKPRARHLAVVRDYVVLGDVDDVGSDGAVPNRVWWSSQADPTAFEAAGATSSFQDLQNGGRVRKIVGGEVGTIFCDSSIFVMTFTVPPELAQFDEVERNRGCLAPGSVASFGRYTIFLDRDGFYAWNGQGTESIGVNKIDQRLLKGADSLDLSFVHRVSSVIDPVNHLYLMAYPTVNANSGVPNRILSYDYINAKWSLTEIQCEWLYRALSEGATLDSLAGTLEDYDISLDDPSFLGGAIQVAGFDTAHTLSFFSGSALTATIDTGEAQLNPSTGQRTLVSSVRPVVIGASNVIVTPYTRNLPTESVSAGSPSTVNATGECPMRSNARYHRFRTQIDGPFTAALGVEVTKASSAGMR